jgi:HopA1 effector protein family
MTNYLEQLQGAIDATTFHSPSTYSWFGREPSRLPSRIRGAMTARTARSYLLYQLQSQLYVDFYTRGSFVKPTSSESGITSDVFTFIEELSAANSGRGSWQNGWEVASAQGDEVTVRRNGLVLWVRLEDCLFEKSNSIERGTTVGIRMPKELRSISPGYYMALSNRGTDATDTEPLIRLYWNLRSAGAVEFVRGVTRLLNEGELFFRLKVLSDPASYNRCDAAVIYFYRRDHHQIMTKLYQVYDEMVDRLKSNVPMFAKRLAPGVGLAEDPGTAESFGQHRCRLLADGMIRANEQGARGPDERLAVVMHSFASAGINLESPYLNSNSTDVYFFPGKST